MLVDPLEGGSGCSEGPFGAAFAPWPIRFYVLWRGRVAYKAQVTRGGGRKCLPGWLLVCSGCSGCCEVLSAARQAASSNPPLGACLLPQPRDCAYDLAELRGRLLQLLADTDAAAGATDAPRA